MKKALSFAPVVLLAVNPANAADTSAGAGGSAPKYEAEEKAIRKMINDVCVGFRSRDARAANAHFAPDVVIFDVPPPLASIGSAGNLQASEDYIQATVPPMICEYTDVHVKVMPGGRDAVGYMFVHLGATLKNGGKVDWMLRETDVFEKRGDKWVVTHVHASMPVDAATGKGVPNAAKFTDTGAKYDVLKK